MMGGMTHTRIWRAHRFVTRFVNPITLRVSGWAPGFGILTYKGRKTGRTYRTPINVFRRDDKYVFVLTYGSDAQWIKNVLTIGECEFHTRGHDLQLVDPTLIVDPTLGPAPLPVRLLGRLVGAHEYVIMRVD